MVCAWCMAQGLYRAFEGYAAVEGLGNLAVVSLTGGNVHDNVQAKAVLNEAGELAKAVDEKIASVTADNAYDSAAIVEFIEELGATAVIPPLSNRKTQGPSIGLSTRTATSSSASSPDSSSSDAQPRAMTSSPRAFSPHSPGRDIHLAGLMSPRPVGSHLI
jgi:transposase